MDLYERLGIKYNLLLQIQTVISKCASIEKAYIFGSRARGDYRYNSDIDIAVFGNKILPKDLYYIEDELDKLNTALDFDIIDFGKISKYELKQNIMKDGVEIYVNRTSK